MNTSDTLWALNLSLAFSELPLLERPAAAKAAGFDHVEFWWPFGTSGRPDRDEVEAFVAAIDGAGVQLIAMNLFAGNMPIGERGVLSHPERVSEFRDSVHIAIEIGERLGTRLFNAPYGHRRDGLDHEEQDALATENLGFAATAAARIGGTILLEPVSQMPQYPIKTARNAVDIINRVTKATGVQNLGFLLDQYHIGMAGGDVLADIQEFGDRIVHVQIADIPNRGEPGSGEGDIRGFVTELGERGYEGALALEFIPTMPTTQALEAWRHELASWS